MKILKQNSGEKPMRVGTWKEVPYNTKEKPNMCVIEPGDTRMPPVKNKGCHWEWVSFETYPV